MKKRIIKILFLIILWMIVFLIIIINRTYAETQKLTLSISTDKSIYSVGDDVEVKIKLNEKIMTSSYYLNYNSSILKFKETKTSSMTVKDYPNDNLIRTIYADLSGKGTNEMIFVFTVKEKSNNNKILFSLENTTMVIAEENKSYSNNQITGFNTKVQITIQEESSNKNTGNINQNKIEDNKLNSIITTNKNNSNITTDKTISASKLPKAGTNTIYFYLIIILVTITIYIGYNFMKLKSYFKY